MNKDKLNIIGAGSVGGHIAQNLHGYSQSFKIEGFFDDDLEKVGTKQFGYPVLGPVSEALELDQQSVVIGIAFPELKKKIVKLLSENSSLNYPILIHRDAWISEAVNVGPGTVIYPGTSINYGSQIEKFVVINMNCALGHHTHIGSYSSLAPGVKTGGNTVVEAEVEMGIGASTLQHIRIGRGSRVGGQSMVTGDVEPEATVVGVPARKIS